MASSQRHRSSKATAAPKFVSVGRSWRSGLTVRRCALVYLVDKSLLTCFPRKPPPSVQSSVVYHQQKGRQSVDRREHPEGFPNRSPSLGKPSNGWKALRLIHLRFGFLVFPQIPWNTPPQKDRRPLSLKEPCRSMDDHQFWQPFITTGRKRWRPDQSSIPIWRRRSGCRSRSESTLQASCSSNVVPPSREAE